MNHILDNEVVELNNDFEKYTADVQFLIDEVKKEMNQTLTELREKQFSQTERIKNVEEYIHIEIQNLKDLFQTVGEKFEIYKQESSRVIKQALTAFDPDRLNQILTDNENRRVEIAQLQTRLAEFSNTSPEKLREELIAGIRLLGERVSKAIQDINERMNNFATEIQSHASAASERSRPPEEKPTDQEGGEFTDLKESSLFDMTDYEVVPRDAIQKLTDLFRKQSSAIKSFIEKHESRLSGFENLLKTYDEENTRLLELLDKRVKRNFRISIGAIIFVILCAVLSRLF